MPAVSVIIPVHNRASLLAEALESVMLQSFRDYEIIIADDCSDDSPGKKAEKLSEKYCVPLKWVKLEKHSGMPGYVRNCGTAEAAGRYLAFLDSDDLWMPEKLQEQIAFMQVSSSEICHTREIWERDGKIISQVSQKHAREGMVFSDSLWKCIIGPSTVMIEKKLFSSHSGFREDLEVAEDYELWIRITQHKPAAYIDKPLTVKRAGKWDQLSEKYGQIEIFRIQALKDLLDKKAFLKENKTLAGTVFKEKCRIYSSGCRKRGRIEESDYYKLLSESQKY